MKFQKESAIQDFQSPNIKFKPVDKNFKNIKMSKKDIKIHKT
jgi:hypothetical protein